MWEHRMVSKSEKKNMQEVFHEAREEELQFQLKKLWRLNKSSLTRNVGQDNSWNTNFETELKLSKLQPHFNLF